MKISTILDHIDSGHMALPEFQRGYVWNSDQVRKLFPSLYLRRPVGGLLVWATESKSAAHRGDGPLAAGVVKLLLDGQQRMTSLYGVVRGKPPKFFDGNAKAFTGLRFHLEQQAFAFYQPVTMKDDPLWIDVTALMSHGQAGHETLVEKLADDPRVGTKAVKYSARISRILGILDIDLHTEEVNRGHVSFQTLLDELEVSPATLKRDLDYLKDQLGAPIVYDRFLNGYKFGEEYRGQKHELPGLWFSERELYSLLMAHQLLSDLDSDGVISRHLQPLLDRIYQMLGTTDADTKALLKRVRIIGSAKRPVSSQFFELVGEALLKRKRLHLRYLTRGRGEVSERDVSPQRLVHYRNTWYVDGWCHTREKLLRFALDAIESAEALETKAKEVSLKQVQAEMDGGYGIYAGDKRQWAKLAFEPQAAQWVSREEWHPEQQSKWLKGGVYELTIPYTEETEILMDILRHGDQVRVLAPDSLVEAARSRLQSAIRRY